MAKMKQQSANQKVAAQQQQKAAMSGGAQASGPVNVVAANHNCSCMPMGTPAKLCQLSCDEMDNGLF
jgi:hypothetical protein